VTIPGWPDGLGLVLHDTIDSTNEEARLLAAQNVTPPLWIMARAQTKGRGRRGREWISEPGNLFATLLVAESGARAAELGFAASLAVGDVVEDFARTARVSLKWPNDVLLDGAKVAGILQETLPRDLLAIGIGVNLSHHPYATEFPAISLKSAVGNAPEPDAALAKLARSMAAWYETWRSSGFAPLREAWLKRAEGLGKGLRARLAHDEIDGVFETLDQDGALMLRRADRTLMRITAGDVFPDSLSPRGRGLGGG